MRITIIGSGNVATHLAAAFKNAGHNIVQVYSRDMQHAAILAYHVKAEPIDNLDSINHATDIFIVSINDDAIGGIAQKLAKYDAVIAHTSGATLLQDIMAYTDKAGVFYPLQTFSKTRELDFRAVPLCIEGATQEITARLIELGQTVSNHVYRVDSGQRKILHVAAVFACNFPNYLYYAAGQLLQQHNLDFNMLRPLILETAEKVQEYLPVNVQTGPAIRNDEKTIAAHLQLLQDNPELQDLYRQISQLIIKMDKGGHAGV
ncbi:MAG TPA: Rossmann-like and DUF2520 domain-containing protein [Mucilaginibacter sp.]|nr:Rossmann-like and DUF2520 domain-containing protein [Mucilaginibacter sp.]